MQGKNKGMWMRVWLNIMERPEQHILLVQFFTNSPNVLIMQLFVIHNKNTPSTKSSAISAILLN